MRPGVSRPLFASLYCRVLVALHAALLMLLTGACPYAAVDFNIERLTSTFSNDPSASSSPNAFVLDGNRIFFRALDAAHGNELWVSDGTDGGTTNVCDITPGPTSSYDGISTLHSGVLFFRANDATHGYELWKSDGTSDGTSLVRDIRPGSANSDISDFVSHNGQLYFRATDSTTSSIWVTNGTGAGTQPVITPACANATYVQPFASFAGQLYFIAATINGPIHLWKTEGSCTSSTLVAELSPPYPLTGSAFSPVVFGGKLYFGLNGGSSYGVWRTDGTAQGTTFLVQHQYAQLAASSTALFYSDANHIFKTDGNDLGTTIATTGYVQGLGVANERVFYLEGNGFDFSLHETNVVPGTSEVVHAGGSSIPLYWNGSYYFSAKDSLGTELWRNAGTSSTNTLVKDISPGSGNSSPAGMTPMNGNLFFAASGPEFGRELWKTDGTDGGTTIVHDINQSPQSVDPQNFSDIGAFALFAGTKPGMGKELWRTDGTPAGTYFLKDIFPGSLWSSPGVAVQLNGIGYFAATSQAEGRELWRSDGTAAGTYLVKDTNPSTSSLSNEPDNLFVWNNLIFYSATSNAGSELWVSNGTEAGTYMLADIYAGAGSSSPHLFTPYKGELYFRAADAAHGEELWKTNGTPAGTQLVVDILPGTASGKPWQLLPIGDTLFLQAYDPTHSYELWKSDGTAAGTVLVKDIVPGSGFGIPDYFTNWNGSLFFEAYDYNPINYSIWRSDGTDQGTTEVIDVPPGGYDIPDSFIPVGDVMYFRKGPYIYKTDGTQAGTYQVGFKYPAPTGTYYVNYLFYDNGWLFFQHTQPSTGAELWAVNCVNDTSFLVHEFSPGTIDSYTQVLGKVNGKLILNARGNENGTALGAQLWSMSPPPNFPAAASDWQLYR